MFLFGGRNNHQYKTFLLLGYRTLSNPALWKNSFLVDMILAHPLASSSRSLCFPNARVCLFNIEIVRVERFDAFLLTQLFRFVCQKVKVRVAVNFRRLFAFVLSMMQLLSHCIDLLSRLNVAQVSISSPLTKQIFAWSLFFKMEILGNALSKFKCKKFSEWLCKPQLRFVRM